MATLLQLQGLYYYYQLQRVETSKKQSQKRDKNMIISDLEHLEVVAESNSIVGGGKDDKKVVKVVKVIVKKPEYKPVAKAFASADLFYVCKST